MGYVIPVDAPVSCSWQCHLDRDPPSSEPGTDYASNYGTPVRCAGTGTVIDVKGSNSNATGRYVTVALDDGNTVRYLHLAEIWVSLGQRVGSGEHIAASGASGFGSDWGYGSHVHVTLWVGPAWASPTVDFQLWEDEMGTIDNTEANYQTVAAFIYRALKWDVRDGTAGVPPAGSDASQYGRTIWDRFGVVDNAVAGVDIDLNYTELAASLVEQGVSVVIVTPPEGSAVSVQSSRFLRVAVAGLGILAALQLGVLAYLLVTG